MNQEHKHTPEELTALLRAKLQGEAVKSVSMPDDQYIKFEFAGARLYVPVQFVQFVEDKPL